MRDVILLLDNVPATRAVAKSIQKKPRINRVEPAIVSVTPDLDLSSFKGGRVHVLGQGSVVAGTAGGYSPGTLAKILKDSNLGYSKHISLVVCQSAEPSRVLNNRNYGEALLDELKVNGPDRVDKISCRGGYVTAYHGTEVLTEFWGEEHGKPHQRIKLNQEIAEEDILKAENRQLTPGRKYSHTSMKDDPALDSENKYIPKGGSALDSLQTNQPYKISYEGYDKSKATPRGMPNNPTKTSITDGSSLDDTYATFRKEMGGL